ncbi:MAG: DUF362 domain-containing protein [Patescibacteria group bacterium]
MTKVNIIQGENRRKVVRESVEALGQSFVDKLKLAKLILIKPDLVHYELQLAAVHVDAVRGLLDVIRMYTKAPVIVGDAAHFGTKAAFRNFGYERLPEQFSDLKLLDLQDEDYVEQTFVSVSGNQSVLRRPKVVMEADLTISITNLKTHKDYGAALAVSNWAEGTMLVPPRVTVQGRVWSRYPWLSVGGPRMMHELLAFLYTQKACDVAIIDGVLAMEGSGPVEGSPVAMGLALSGYDAVAVDAVAATLMGLDPHGLGYLELLAEAGLGVNDMSKIDVPPLQLNDLMRSFQLPSTTREHLLDWQTE